ARWHAEKLPLARVVQYECPHLVIKQVTEHVQHSTVIRSLRRGIDDVVKNVLRAGVASGDFDVPDIPGTTLALLSLPIDVARWYHPSSRRSPETIGATYGNLAVRLVRI
ncbi:MAG: TetR family transcriptional regulator, partial [Pseudolysinimonas sp.]